MTKRTIGALTLLGIGALSTACSPVDGLAPSKPADTTVKMDFFHRPFPDMPLPNDLATRFDATSATGRRLNASMMAPTSFEADTRTLLDDIDGWGVFQPLSIPFTAPLDVQSIVDHHRQSDYDQSDDVVYLVNVDRSSKSFGEAVFLDLGNGNFPVALEDRTYWKNDPRADSISLGFEEADEDVNRNGKLDPGEDVNGNGVLDPGEDENHNGKLDGPEDTDADGILDVPNYLPGKHPAATDLGARSDALMTFYDRLTNSLLLRPMVPLDEGTTYAVVVTRRLLDAHGAPVGSPYPYINHTAQTSALEPLLEVLPKGLTVDDIAYTYSFTTQTVAPEWKSVRDGIYGHGVQAHLSTEFPAEIDALLPLRDAAAFPGMTKPQLLYGEVWKPTLADVAVQFLGGDASTEYYAKLVDGTGYIDYFVIGSYQSPQLFPRDDAEGKPLGLNHQSWPPDVDKKAAKARAETVYFTLAMPRKEVSVRGQGKPVPIVIMGHGYGSNRFEVMQYASYLCSHGVAVLGIDGPSHGIGGFDATQQLLVKGALSKHGVGVAADAVLADRAFDQNGDGKKDSGVDFWTAYLFHTRDIVRQFALDYMQLIRIVRTFDGKRRWKLDTNGDGSPDLAGDFDGDGEVDIGADSPIGMSGGSLGGIMSMIMGSMEPEVRAIAPISGGGGLGDIGVRSKQAGVSEAFILRVMGPLYVGTLDPTSGDLALSTIIPDLNSTGEVSLGTVKGVTAGDSLVVENLANGKRGCGFVSAGGTVRAAVESDVGDPTRILVYKGPQIVPSTTCEIREGAKPFATIDTFQKDAVFQAQEFKAGKPLVALAEGLGLRRDHPDFRRFGALGQLVLDRADPAVVARHMQLDPLAYATGQITGAHALVSTSIGDMNVPASSGASFARAAGLIEFLKADPRYGKSVQQVLIDTYTMEAVDTYKRFLDHAGNGVHLDIEYFSQGTDSYGTNVPRMNPPLRIGWNVADRLGGKSVAIFPYNIPTGQHGFDLPGGMTDNVRKACRDACTETGDDPCGCGALVTYDVGNFMMNMIADYLASGGTAISDDLCQSRDDCPTKAAVPAARDVASLK